MRNWYGMLCYKINILEIRNEIRKCEELISINQAFVFSVVGAWVSMAICVCFLAIRSKLYMECHVYR